MVLNTMTVLYKKLVSATVLHECICGAVTNTLNSNVIWTMVAVDVIVVRGVICSALPCDSTNGLAS